VGDHDIRRRIYPITRSIWLGPFASPERLSTLHATGITHIFNVGEAPSVLFAGTGSIREVAWFPIADLEPIPNPTAIDCLDVLHKMACDAESRVYVHCLAGWNRSPTILWLYLVACGIEANRAKEWITRQAPDAVPGHTRLVREDLHPVVRQHGSRNYVPHPRPDALEPA
jgi:hypothetical protein